LQTNSSAQSIFHGPLPARVTVQRGDTVYALSRRYGVPVKDIIGANRLSPPYILHVGESLLLPRPQVYVVQRGDTLYGIARVYGVDMHDLAGLNRLGPPYNIWVGQSLALPSQATSGTQAAPVASAAQPSLSPAPSSVPADTSTRATPVNPPQTSSAAPSSTAQAPVIPAPKPTPQVAQTQTQSPAPQPEARATKPPQPPPRAGRTFAWPVTGDVVGRYGPSVGGTRNDGINIAVAKGTDVRAAENGVIVYAGNELKGFGNLLLIKHSDGWMTAYAHNDSFIAKRGETVKRGQVIARAGQSGNVDSPQVHFEVRRNSKAVDPLEYMERTVAAR
jgi:murein DD-endopeptidase MepM/ murein hydrolase activator NlpD